MIFDQARSGEGIDVIDRLHLDHTDLFSLDEGRDWNDQGEFLGLAFIVARHGNRGGLALAREHDLGRLVEQLGIRLGDVETAKRRGRSARCRDLCQHGCERDGGLETTIELAGHCVAP